jgi:hypothetical protein
VDEALVSQLETAIADTGALLVRAQKYRVATSGEGADLRRAVLTLGDAARRLHRQGAFDEDAVRRLGAVADSLGTRLRALLTAVVQAPTYLEARQALERGDRDALARSLPLVFADLERVAVPGDLFHPLAWLRRGRLRPAVDVAADARAARDDGVEGEGDDLTPGADAALPALRLTPAPPPDEPVLLRLPSGTLAGPVHRLAETDDHLVHGRRVRLPGVVRLGRTLGDEQLRVEIPPADWVRWRADLTAALLAAAVPVEEA